MCKKDVIKILVGSLNQAGMKVADYLKKQGYNVAQSDYNPLEIQLEVLKSKPDFLIISEITEFPYELCKNLKGACPKLKIIMLSDRKTNNGSARRPRRTSPAFPRAPSTPCAPRIWGRSARPCPPWWWS